MLKQDGIVRSFEPPPLALLHPALCSITRHPQPRQLRGKQCLAATRTHNLAVCALSLPPGDNGKTSSSIRTRRLALGDGVQRPARHRLRSPRGPRLTGVEAPPATDELSRRQAHRHVRAAPHPLSRGISTLRHLVEGPGGGGHVEAAVPLGQHVVLSAGSGAPPRAAAYALPVAVNNKMQVPHDRLGLDGQAVPERHAEAMRRGHVCHVVAQRGRLLRAEEALSGMEFRHWWLVFRVTVTVTVPVPVGVLALASAGFWLVQLASVWWCGAFLTGLC